MVVDFHFYLVALGIVFIPRGDYQAEAFLFSIYPLINLLFPFMKLFCTLILSQPKSDL